MDFMVTIPVRVSVRSGFATPQQIADAIRDQFDLILQEADEGGWIPTLGVEVEVQVGGCEVFVKEDEE